MRALGESLRRYASRGVTAIYEGHGIAPEVLRVYRETHERGRLTLRCSLALSPTWDSAAEAERAIPELAAWAGGRGTGDDRLRLAGICLHYGGDPDVARILHAGQPYTAWAGFVESANGPAEYARQAELAARHGLRINTIVTRCLPEVLDAWEAIAARWPIRDLRWALVHLHVATEGQLARIRALGAVATTNPISYLWRSGAAEVARLGGSRGDAHPAPEPGSTRHPVRPGHRQQAGQSVARLQRRRRPPRHGHGRDPRRGPAALARAGLARADRGRRPGDLRRARARRARPGLCRRPRGAGRRSADRPPRRGGGDDRAPDDGGRRDRPRGWLGRPSEAPGDRGAPREPGAPRARGARGARLEAPRGLRVWAGHRVVGVPALHGVRRALRSADPASGPRGLRGGAGLSHHAHPGVRGAGREARGSSGRTAGSMVSSRSPPSAAPSTTSWRIPGSPRGWPWSTIRLGATWSWG